MTLTPAARKVLVPTVLGVSGFTPNSVKAVDSISTRQVQACFFITLTVFPTLMLFDPEMVLFLPLKTVLALSLALFLFYPHGLFS